jgi:hypothetical protein
LSTTLLPQAFWFRLNLACPRREGLSGRGKGPLVDLPESCRLVETNTLNGQPPWAEVRAAWSSDGLAIQIEAEGRPRPPGALDRPESATGATIWVDTRDTRDVSRATKFCHRFEARLVPRSGRSAMTVDFRQRPIARALADAPLSGPDDLQARAELSKRGWRLGLFLTAGALHGFDPETNRRLGFAYQISDPAREDQFLGVGREFPLGENPSLWSTLELRDHDEPATP